MIQTGNIILKIYVMNDLQIIYTAEYIAVIYCIKNWIKFFWNQIGLLFHFET